MIYINNGYKYMHLKASEYRSTVTFWVSCVTEKAGEPHINFWAFQSKGDFDDQ
jgi:hypothetical protein